MLPLWDSHKLKRPGQVTRALVGANLVIFAIEVGLMVFSPELFNRLLGNYALVPADWWGNVGLIAGWIPVGSSLFLHGGLAHVVGNCWFLWVFGRSLEDHLGSWRFLLIYSISGVGAAALQTATDVDSMVPMVGASGAISGVLGAYLVCLSGRWIIALVPWFIPIVPLPAFLFLVLWFGLQLFNGIGGLNQHVTGGTAWWAHVGGFATGVVVARGIGTAEKRPKRRKS